MARGPGSGDAFWGAELLEAQTAAAQEAARQQFVGGVSAQEVGNEKSLEMAALERDITLNVDALTDLRSKAATIEARFKIAQTRGDRDLIDLIKADYAETTAAYETLRAQTQGMQQELGILASGPVQ